uniref:Uncharacterized protein n=1 Tax=Molossus molossus TaxID=27622 RepID=A0A7J8BLG6_MOLMO|nr:hypothetical protein HJG59_010173 [Molossus molossus]
MCVLTLSFCLQMGRVVRSYGEPRLISSREARQRHFSDSHTEVSGGVACPPLGPTPDSTASMRHVPLLGQKGEGADPPSHRDCSQRVTEGGSCGDERASCCGSSSCWNSINEGQEEQRPSTDSSPKKVVE